MIRTFSPSERTVLHQLAALAWERELGSELGRLATSFDEWREGRLDPRALNERIQRFHQGTSRKLRGLYTSFDASHVVARALVRGVLQHAEVPPPVLERLTSRIEYHQQDRG